MWVVRQQWFSGATLVALLTTSGCLKKSESRPAIWSFLSAATLEPNCASATCHSRSAAVAGLDFSNPDRGFVSLSGLWIWIVDPTGTPAQGCRAIDGTTVCQREHRSLVVPFDPAQSRLIQMLRGRDAPLMPPDRSLPESDIRLIENWILDGAIDDRAVRPAGEFTDGGTDDAATSVDGGAGDEGWGE